MCLLKHQFWWPDIEFQKSPNVNFETHMFRLLTGIK